jgi:hypothetical protein
MIFVLGLYFVQLYLPEVEGFCLNMASHVQDGGRKSRELNFEIKQHFCIQSFAMNLQHDPNSYFVKLVKIVCCKQIKFVLVYIPLDHCNKMLHRVARLFYVEKLLAGMRTVREMSNCTTTKNKLSRIN